MIEVNDAGEFYVIIPDEIVEELVLDAGDRADFDYDEETNSFTVTLR